VGEKTGYSDKLTRRWSSLARDYDSAVLSPFLPGVKFPLNGALRRLAMEWRRDGSLSGRIALDLGCGTGPALPILSRYFPLVIGVDFAAAMLEASRRRVRTCNADVVVVRGAGAAAREIARWSSTGHPRRIVLARADLNDLRPLNGVADVVVAINSLVQPVKRAAAPLFRRLAQATQSGGTAIVVLPALDGLAYLMGLHERYGGSQRPVDVVRWRDGMMKDGSGMVQKYYRPGEIRALLRTQGFRRPMLQRVTYPWRLAEAYGWGSFRGQPPVWDWYTEANRA
jgi:SAM-dependent methyltransferase